MSPPTASPPLALMVMVGMVGVCHSELWYVPASRLVPHDSRSASPESLTLLCETLADSHASLPHEVS